MTDRRRLSTTAPAWASPRATGLALAAAVIGGVLWVLGAMASPGQAFFSYLAAYTFALEIALGALALLMIEHLIAAGWFVAVRRVVETIAATLPVFALLFIPVAIGAHALYPWTTPAALDSHARLLVEKKAAWLNLPFFLVRAAIYLACWAVLSELLWRWSVRQDETGDARWTARQRAISGPGLIALAFTLTFAAFDWVMSLAPTWYSTIFGVIVFAGGVTAALGLSAWMLAAGAGRGTFGGAITADHFSAVGKMLFTFVIFWAYVSFCQLLIIWIADVPEEVTWYVPRLTGSWLWLGVALALGHFAAPFFLLLSYQLKRRASVLAGIGAWILAMHYVDIYWIVMPQLHRGGVHPHWLDLAALAAVTGVACAYGTWRVRGAAPLAIGDPLLAASLEYTET